MNAFERIMNTLDRKPVDRLACDMWATAEVLAKLRARLAVPTDEAVYDELGIDKIVWLAATYPDLPPSRDEWGVEKRSQTYDGGTYQETSKSPLASLETIAQLERFPWPDPERFDYAALARSAAAVRGRPAMLSFISLFETYTGMRGFENALADLYVEKDFASYALERIASIQIRYIEKSLAATGDDIGIVYFSDDMGMQDRQLFSTGTWDEAIGPRAERIIDTIHRFGKKAFYHTDGSAPEIVDRLVGLGIDILNPIQHVCPGMERERLAKLYGGKVVFHGAVENQKVLPFGTPDDVRKEPRDCMRLLGSGGGYIVASCHNLQPNTPVDNILAMYETVREEGAKYLH
ncbi:MAG: hypothetical protein A2Z99_10215 [Treponema sp. GWB1_62_6]|nr:MAG: hypothetical protein A2Z99_10215 [Treponema sp. GWB1_62_6]